MPLFIQESPTLGKVDKQKPGFPNFTIKVLNKYLLDWISNPKLY